MSVATRFCYSSRLRRSKKTRGDRMPDSRDRRHDQTGSRASSWARSRRAVEPGYTAGTLSTGKGPAVARLALMTGTSSALARHSLRGNRHGVRSKRMLASLH